MNTFDNNALNERLSEIIRTRTTPDNITELKPDEIIVFGSNIMGRHAGGLAEVCHNKFGAIWGQSEGFQGQCYGINTMSGIQVMINQIDRFIDYASLYQHLTFLVTPIACGIAGYKPKDIAPLFYKAIPLNNIHLPQPFWVILNH